MNSPYCGKFRVTQQYLPGVHDGIDLVGIDSKEIHATVSGTVYTAGWENYKNPRQGFGQFVCIRGTDGNFYYYGHLSKINVIAGDLVACTDVIGIEGSTGYSTGSHCHYEVRTAPFKGAKVIDVTTIAQIPNVLGGIYDDGYRPPNNTTVPTKPKKTYNINNINDVKAVQKALNAANFNCGEVDGIIGEKTTEAMFNYIADTLLQE